MSLEIEIPFAVYPDVDGQPLDDGYIYIGTNGLNPETNPISVYWDSAMSIPAAQPIRTINGFPSNSGTPGRLYVNAVNYSITIRNKNSTLVHNVASATGIDPISDIIQIINDLATAKTIAGTTSRNIFVKGRTSTGDGYEGQFYWDASDLSTQVAVDTTNAMYIPPNSDSTGASGAWVRIHQGEVNIQAFGAVGDGDGLGGGTDDSAAMQAGINYAIEYKVALILPNLIFNIDSPLFIMKWSGSAFTDFVTMTMKGRVTPYGNANGKRGAGIFANFDNTFAIGIQGSRGVTIENINITGQNDMSGSISAPEYIGVFSEATFQTGTCRDQRYSPYSGICIDPFGSSTPADGGYPGLSAYYVASATSYVSSHTFIRNCSIRKFIVGVMNSPNGTSQQNDNGHVEGCNIFYNKVAYAIGQSQCRHMTISKTEILYSYIAVDGAQYGQRQGLLPAIEDLNIGVTKYCFNTTSSFGKGIVKNLHAESFASIGFLGANANTQFPVTFESCHFNIGKFDGRSADLFLATNTPTKFNSCEFWGDYYAQYQFPILKMYILGTRGSVDFDNCGFKGLNSTNGPIEFQLAPFSNVRAQNWQNDVWFENCYLTEGTTRFTNASQISHRIRDHIPGGYKGRMIIPDGAEYRFSNSSTDRGLIQYVNNRNQNEVDLGTQTVTVGANGTATFTAADATIIRVGDLIYTTTVTTPEYGTGQTPPTFNYYCLGMVSNISGSTISLAGVGESITTGSYAMKAQWWTRYHVESKGDVTSASADITNVTNATTYWAVGDKIQGAGIPAGAYVTAVAGTTITISKAATATDTDVPLYDADMHFLQGSRVGNNLSGSATFATSGTVSVTFDSVQPNANYKISIAGNAAETFHWSSKGVAGFTLNSSNASSTATVDWQIEY